MKMMSSIKAFLLIEIAADFSKKKVVAAFEIRIAYGITDVACDFRVRLKRKSRREISGCVIACKPICRQRKLVIDRLFKGELTAAALRLCGNNIVAEMIPAKSDASLRFEGFGNLRVSVIASVIRLVTHRQI